MEPDVPMQVCVSLLEENRNQTSCHAIENGPTNEVVPFWLQATLRV